MAAEVWFRGQSTTVSPSRPGGDLHDFGDGLYFTDEIRVARTYADTRVLNGGGIPQILSLSIERSQLGSILNLSSDPRWKTYLDTPVMPSGPNVQAIIQRQHELYGEYFGKFLKINSIDIRNYDAVIGPELVRGGQQLCIVDKGGRPTAIRLQIQRQLVELPRAIEGLPVDITSVEVAPMGSEVLEPKSPLRRALGNQGAVATVGLMIYGALQIFGEAGIKKRAQEDLDGKHAQSIARHLARGEGVLVIIAVSEANWITPMGDHMRSYVDTYIQGGRTQAEAIRLWQQPRYLQGAQENCHVASEYVWIPPIKR